MPSGWPTASTFRSVIRGASLTMPQAQPHSKSWLSSRMPSSTWMPRDRLSMIVARSGRNRRENCWRTIRSDCPPWPMTWISRLPCSDSESKTLTVKERSRLIIAAVSRALVASRSSAMALRISGRVVVPS
ncbi:hypothetical protein STENM223S_00709 [Streptomyces tendae]